MFTVLGFTFRSVIYFKLIFVKGLRPIFEFFFLACACLNVPAQFIEKIILDLLYFLCSFVSNDLSVFISGILFIFTTQHSALYLVQGEYLPYFCSVNEQINE